MRDKFFSHTIIAALLFVLPCISCVIFTQKLHAAPMNCHDITKTMLERAGKMEMVGARKSSDSTKDYCSWGSFRMGNSKQYVDIYFSGNMATTTPVVTHVGSLKTLHNQEFGCKQGATINGRNILVRAQTCQQAKGILRFLITHQTR